MAEGVLTITRKPSTGETSASETSPISKKEYIKHMEQMWDPPVKGIVYSTDNSLRHTHSLTIENFIGIWLDLNISHLNSTISNYIRHLRNIINFFKIFFDLDRCNDYLAKVKNEKVVLIISGAIEQNFISRFCEMAQIISIYIFSDGTSEHRLWTYQYTKVKGVFNRVQDLIDVLANDLSPLENALTPISVIPPPSAADLNKLDASFMYSQLLKEILLEDEYDAQQKRALVQFCRFHYAENNEDLKIIDEFDKQYPHPSTIWWYTRECFLYRILNKILRVQDIEVIIRMGLVIRDLHLHIKQLYLEQEQAQSFIVYRGQGMFQDEFGKIIKNKGGLLAFNSFLSTSIDQKISLKFARQAMKNRELTAILFKIKIDITHTIVPFASVDKLSYYANREKEILFSMHTIFRIEETKEIEPGLFQINLTLTNENDQQLAELTEYIRQATREQTTIRRLGSLMIAMGKFNKAEEVYATLLDITAEYDREGCAFLHHQIGLINWEKRDLMRALSQFQHSLGLYLSCLSSNNSQLSSIYSNIGTVLQEQGDLTGALKYLKLALDIDLHAPQTRQLDIATRYNNIGLVLGHQGEYHEAINSFERALEIELVHLSSLHPLLATTYNNIGLIFQKLGNNRSALSYYQKTLDIFERSLPSDHSSLAIIHNNMAHALDDLYQIQEAVQHTEQAIKIGYHALGSDHPQVQQYQQYLEELRRKL